MRQKALDSPPGGSIYLKLSTENSGLRASSRTMSILTERRWNCEPTSSPGELSESSPGLRKSTKVDVKPSTAKCVKQKNRQVTAQDIVENILEILQ